ncbi:hypothetical protein [Microbacterium rhizosphaerae]
MRIAGVLPYNAPDPRVESARQLAGLPFPLMGLAPQPTIEDMHMPSIMEATDRAGRSQLAVSFTYRLWRNPSDPDDPANLKDLDPEEQAALDTVPPWPRPAWLPEFLEIMRYPRLWEAVRTSWSRDPSDYTALERQLVDHTNNILMNHYRNELGPSPGPTEDGPWQVGLSSVNAAALEIDREEAPAIEIDTDPFVYAIGAQLRPDLVTTVVIAREHLPYVRLALHTRTPATK